MIQSLNCLRVRSNKHLSIVGFTEALFCQFTLVMPIKELYFLPLNANHAFLISVASVVLVGEVGKLCVVGVALALLDGEGVVGGVLISFR